MSSTHVKELRERRARAHAFAVSLLSKPNQTKEERASFDQAMAEVDRLGADIKAIESGNSPYSNDYRSNPWTDPKNHEIARIFGIYLRGGANAISDTDRKILMERRDTVNGQGIFSPGTAGGYFVPQGFVYDVDVATKYFAPMLDGTVCGLLETASGNLMPYPTSDDTGNVATQVNENTQVTEKDFTVGHVNFSAYKFTSGVVRVSLELMQDSAFNLESFLAKRFGERFGRGFEAAFTNGTGSSQPYGIVPAILASGVTPVTAVGSSANDGTAATGANSVGYADYVNLEHSIDPTYRRGGKYMLNDATLSATKTLLDKYGRPLWTPGMKDGAPDTINGYSYVVNQAFDKIGASKNVVAFGDWSKFIIRKAGPYSVLRLDQRYADYGQVGFLAFARVDSQLVDAGTHPVNLLINHS